MPPPSLSLQVTSAFPCAHHPMLEDALQQCHEIGGVFGEEGWQGTRHPPPHAAVLPVGRWERAAQPPPEQGFPGRLRSCQIPGRNKAKEETAHSSMYYFCLLRIIVFQAKENRSGGMLLQMPEREEQLRSSAFPSSEQRQAGETPNPADSQGHRWSRKQPKTLLGC